MAINVTNRTRQLLIMELNNGEAVYLAPDSTSEPIDETLVEGNEMYSKLLRNNFITSAEGEERPKPKKPKSEK